MKIFAAVVIGLSVLLVGGSLLNQFVFKPLCENNQNMSFERCWYETR